MSAGASWSRVAALTAAVLDACDWPALGAIYCNDPVEARWPERRALVQEHGLALARRLLAALPRGGTSLWVGAGLAEVPVLLAETMRQGRQVLATNLRVAECELLNRALEQAVPEMPCRYQPVDARTLAAAAAFDHLGCVSVFTDPETWPVLSEVAYGRLAPVQIDVAKFVAEREQARELAAVLFGRLSRPGWITTTAEEVSWFLEQAELAGAAIEADEELVPTALVGDPVGLLQVR
ncbi:MAG: hypothetical protein JNK49_11030 [Planctomycetes bacterium]|nr:hypothetical protein [Planctomycetota bacterium]